MCFIICDFMAVVYLTFIFFQSTTDNKATNIPTTVRDIETHTKQAERVPWFNYATDQEEFQKRIEKFKNETQAMLTRPRCLEITVDKGKYLKNDGNTTNFDFLCLSF